MRILIADDDSSSRLIVKAALKNLGHECHTVSSGDQAWNAFQTELPDVVISDWQLPGLTGPQVEALYQRGAHWLSGGAI